MNDDDMRRRKKINKQFLQRRKFAYDLNINDMKSPHERTLRRFKIRYGIAHTYAATRLSCSRIFIYRPRPRVITITPKVQNDVRFAFVCGEFGAIRENRRTANTDQARIQGGGGGGLTSRACVSARSCSEARFQTNPFFTRPTTHVA